MTGMKSKTMDRWALELQWYNKKFQHVAGKDNVVVDMISCLKTANLYKGPEDWEVSKTPESVDNIMENFIFEIHSYSHSSHSANFPTNLDSLIEQQKSDKFCKNKVIQLQCQNQPDFELDDKRVLRKLVCLHHNWTSTVAVPKSLVINIIYGNHECRGHQGIMRTVNMIHRYFLWPGMRLSIYHHIKTCKLCAQFLSNKVNTKPLHLEIPRPILICL